MPAHHRSFAPEWQQAADNCDIAAEHIKVKAKERHDTTARQLPRLHLGSYVDVQVHSVDDGILLVLSWVLVPDVTT